MPLALARLDLAPRARTWIFQWRTALAGIFALALAVRETYNLTVARAYVPLHDAAWYVAVAQHMLHWGCYCYNAPGQPTTIRPPGFPFFIAAVYVLTGADPLHARLVLGIVGSVTCLLVAYIARDLFGPRAGIVAGLVAAIYPQLFIYDAWLYTESLAICLFAASCYAFMCAARLGGRWRWALAGALLGLACLVRPSGIYGLAALAVWIIIAVWQRQMPWRGALVAGLLAVAGCVAVLAPWTVRNAIVTRGAFVPLSTESGIVLAGGYNEAAFVWPGFRGSWVNPWVNPYIDPSDRKALLSLPSDCWGPCEVVLNSVTTRIALHWATTHVSDLPKLEVLRMRQFWTPASPVGEAGMPVWRPYAVLLPTAVFALAALGLLALRRRWREALMPCLFGATIIAGALIFYGSPRFRAPLEPLLVALAGGGLVWLAARAAPLLGIQARAPEPVSATPANGSRS